VSQATLSLTAGSSDGFLRWANHRSEAVRRARSARLRVLLGALAVPPAQTTETLVAQLRQRLADPSADELWLALAVLTATLPGPSAVERAMRSCRLDGPLAAFDEALHARSLAGYLRHRRDLELSEVVVLTGEVVVDLHNTASTTITTGIQRVARETAKRWQRSHAPVFVAWHPRRAALVRLTEYEMAGEAAASGVATRSPGADRAVLVPWRCTYLLPELMAELPRVAALQGLFRYSASTSAAIGYDCVPLMVPETVASDAVVNGFAAMLAGLAHADRIATISEAAAVEYRGWRRMLAGAGLIGPDIAAIALPVHADRPTRTTLEKARARFLTDELPMVLAVGSHEPRKNHLAVLHAARLLWRDGIRFGLAFIGGAGWGADSFRREVEELRCAGHPVEVHADVADDELWAAYTLARCTVFPSLDEGFGLPIAESLACGTPVITSNYGSMLEVAAGGGALLVDPRDDHDIARAIERLVNDDRLYAALREQALVRHDRTWDQYAEAAWDYLVSGKVRPSADMRRPEAAIPGTRV
jgi:glycosyltransferase involved in cell wall biosynthesis